MTSPLTCTEHSASMRDTREALDRVSTEILSLVRGQKDLAESVAETKRTVEATAARLDDLSKTVRTLDGRIFDTTAKASRLDGRDDGRDKSVSKAIPLLAIVLSTVISLAALFISLKG